jgi:hypothetical protein
MPSREYLLRGLNDSDVRAYLDYQVSLAALLGANPTAAERELTESLMFEIQLANVSGITCSKNLCTIKFVEIL